MKTQSVPRTRGENPFSSPLPTHVHIRTHRPPSANEPGQPRNRLVAIAVVLSRPPDTYEALNAAAHAPSDDVAFVASAVEFLRRHPRGNFIFHTNVTDLPVRLAGITDGTWKVKTGLTDYLDLCRFIKEGRASVIVDGAGDQTDRTAVDLAKILAEQSIEEAIRQQLRLQKRNAPSSSTQVFAWNGKLVSC